MHSARASAAAAAAGSAMRALPNTTTVLSMRAARR
jgi:hypothetical protein